jgi:hypothetical protein
MCTKAWALSSISNRRYFFLTSHVGCWYCNGARNTFDRKCYSGPSLLYTNLAFITSVVCDCFSIYTQFNWQKYLFSLTQDVISFCTVLRNILHVAVLRITQKTTKKNLKSQADNYHIVNLF